MTNEEIKGEEKESEERRDEAKGIKIPTWLWVALASFLLIVFGIPLLGGQLFGPGGGGTSVERVSENPDQMIGQTVTVSSDVEDTIGNRAFTLDTPGFLDGKLLVVGPRPFEPAGGGPGELLFNNGDSVQVTGTVEKFNLQEFEQQFSVDLQDEQFKEFEGKPVIIADSIQKLEQ